MSFTTHKILGKIVYKKTTHNSVNFIYVPRLKQIRVVKLKLFS